MLTCQYLQEAIETQTECCDLLDSKTPIKSLLPFEDRLVNEFQSGILFNFEEYLALVDWTGRIIRKDKRDFLRSAVAR